MNQNNLPKLNIPKRSPKWFQEWLVNHYAHLLFYVKDTRSKVDLMWKLCLGILIILIAQMVIDRIGG